MSGELVCKEWPVDCVQCGSAVLSAVGCWLVSPVSSHPGPAKDPPHLSELHSSPSVSGGMTTGTPPLSIPPLSTPSLSTTARSRKLLCKSHSVGSLGSLGASSESPTLSSIWEAHSYDTVPDFLSSIGFDDFQSRNLIPDRFITPDVECAKPSFMRQATIGSLPLPLLDPASLDQVCVEEEMCEGQEVCVEPADNVPLGATAETVVVHAPADLGSDPLQVSVNALLPVMPADHTLVQFVVLRPL